MRKVYMIVVALAFVAIVGNDGKAGGDDRARAVTARHILDAADAALREAKRSGRGRLVLSAAPGDRSGRRPGSEGPSGRNEGPRPSD